MGTAMIATDSATEYVIKGDNIVTQCCYCGAWQTTSGYVGGHSPLHTNQGYTNRVPLTKKLHVDGQQAGEYLVSHGVCPCCYELVIMDYRACCLERGRMQR
jgi:hypothetical protein